MTFTLSPDVLRKHDLEPGPVSMRSGGDMISNRIRSSQGASEDRGMNSPSRSFAIDAEPGWKGGKKDRRELYYFLLNTILRYRVLSILIAVSIAASVYTFLFVCRWDVPNARRYLAVRLSLDDKTLCPAPVDKLRHFVMENPKVQALAAEHSQVLQCPIDQVPLTSLLESSVSLKTSQRFQAMLEQAGVAESVKRVAEDTEAPVNKLAVSTKLRKERHRRCFPNPLGEILRQWRRSSDGGAKICPEMAWALTPELYDETYELWELFCRLSEELDIEWFGESGVILGSMRHHDIIPWDDDVDIRMPDQDWKRLYHLLKNDLTTYHMLDVTESSLPYGFRGKIWLKSSKTHPWFRVWKYPFLDIWTYTPDGDETSFHEEESETKFPLSYIQPLHFRPLGKLMIPFPNRPLRSFGLQGSPLSPAELHSALEECHSSTYNHVAEVKRMHFIKSACLLLADKIPFVTRRIRRRECPYNTTTVGLRVTESDKDASGTKKTSRLLQCFGCPKASSTQIVVADPLDLATSPSLPNILLTYYNFTAPWSPMDNRLPGHWVPPPSKSDSTIWPVFFVWECPRSLRNENLDEGIIEELSIGGIPTALIEICQGDYRDVAYDVLPT